MDKLRLLALLALCSGFSTVRAGEPLNLTLEQALRLTDSANVTVLLSRAAAAQAVAQLDAQATLQSMLATVSESYFAHLRDLRRIVVLDANIQERVG